MGTAAALLNTSVLFSPAVRDLLLQCAEAGLYQARWSKEVLVELQRALIKRRPDIGEARISRLVSLMTTNFERALVTGHERWVQEIDLPDPNDRHVLAAAIESGCTSIVTLNIRDFPAAALQPYGVAALPPDQFLLGLLIENADALIASAATIRRRLESPPITAERYLEILRHRGLTQLSDALETFAHRL